MIFLHLYVKKHSEGLFAGVHSSTIRDPEFLCHVSTGNMKTFSAKSETVRRDWFVVDADNKVLGRLAAEVAHRLRGKHKPEYTPHVDTGDYIVVVNADKIAVTGNKYEDKIYYHHTGYPGGIKSASFRKMMEKDSTRVIQLAVKGMLPRTKLGRAMLLKLKIYPGAEHQHQAQQPKTLEI